MRTTTELILEELHQAIAKLGGSARPTTLAGAAQAVRELRADGDLRSIADSWSEATLDDDEILDMLRNWNAGVPVFQTIYAARSDG